MSITDISKAARNNDTRFLQATSPAAAHHFRQAADYASLAMTTDGELSVAAEALAKQSWATAWKLMAA
jgi:hypothetical protein